ncbi:potassium channel family protein [Mesomycoplasma lagogenitalium]|uniref:TrkA family potassium uptake protein n=1 Tax=Mesomycoplasma lagogenitalium TaxID=171286 RepID=A0ABY8LSV2_9BACT|nr:TrkA family potassium uptake protein [Mesomycoplasma lagogenitalium]WGI36335.1 TrkA family potassium uptake protein [Mesomycoplasma lagogenitalium]
MARKNDRICVIGAGRFGHAIIAQLHKLNKQVIVIDKEEKNLLPIKDYAISTYIADAADLKTLEAIGIDDIDTVIVALTENIEIIAALLELKITNIIARANNHRHARVLKQIGVPIIVRPEEEAGIRTALLATNKSFMKYTNDLQELGGGYVVGSTELISSKYFDITLKKANFTSNNVIVVMVKRNGNHYLPDGNFKLQKEDLITFIGKIDDVTKVFELIGKVEQKNK